MDAYIARHVSDAKELLESGIQFNRPVLINQARNLFSQIRNLTKGNTTYWDAVRENMIRACSALCIHDSKNAVKYLDEASTYDNNNPVILNNYGYVYHTYYSDWDKSIANYEKCLLIDPTYTVAYLGIIDVYRSLRHHNIELEYCKKAVNNCENSPEIWNALGLAMLHNHDYGNMNKIFSCFSTALEKEPSAETKAKILVNSGHLHGILGDFSLAVFYYLQAIEADSKHYQAFQNILLNLHYFSDLDVTDPNFQAVLKRFNIVRQKEPVSELINKLHVELTRELYGSKIPDRPVISRGLIDRKIRLGYITADLVDHAVSYFARCLFSHYNKEAFDVHIYSNNIYDAASVAEIPCTSYKCVSNQSAQDVVSVIKNDQIDILIDLSGHTSGNRLDVIALRPAPIILTYLGYPDDTGFPFVRRISDRYTEVSNYSSSISVPIKLQRLFLCYTPSKKTDYKDFVKSYVNFKPTKDIVTFGCFCKLQKINSHVIETWKVLLTKVPKSRLILKSRYFQNKDTREEWKRKFGDLADRVLFLKGTNTHEEHMQLYKLIDIHLDTFPYSGTTITTESLYMNVPVVSLAIPKKVGHVQRVSGSILTSLGLQDDCIASSVQEYVEKAAKLVNRLPHLSSVRKRFLSSDITNATGFMQSYEQELSNIFMDAIWEQERQQV